LTLTHVGEKGSIGYRAALWNPQPPGEIRSEGSIGPWDEDDPGKTPVSGTYTYEHANLAVFEGISGTLASHGTFSGTIGHIETSGEAQVPDFCLSGTSHSVHLLSTFQAVVDGTNGDTYLQSVSSQFERTTLAAKGQVAGQPGQEGKTISLEMAASRGRIEDLLYLFTNEPRPSMTGSIKLRATVQVPPGPQEFLRKMNLAGTCGIDKSQFTNPHVQQPVDALSESAQGENKKQQADDPDTALSEFTGSVSVKDGVATLSHVGFSAVGTRARLHGTYNLLNRKVDLHGILYTEGKLADTTSGFKALVLKAIGPFLKHKSVTVVPFSITGIAPHPSFALDITGKHRERSLPAPGQ
jgi:hypothetical protein